MMRLRIVCEIICFVFYSINILMTSVEIYRWSRYSETRQKRNRSHVTDMKKVTILLKLDLKSQTICQIASS